MDAGQGALTSHFLILRSDCFFQFVDQHAHIQRLDQIAVHGGLERLLPVFLKGVGRHGQDGNRVGVLTAQARIPLEASSPSMTGMRISIRTA